MSLYFESDEEEELEDLRKLNAAIEEDEAASSRTNSRVSYNTKLSTCDSVQDDFSDINTAIALNKLYDEKLQALENKLHNRLQECRHRLKVLQGMVTVEKTNIVPFYYVACAKPYFKDINGFTAPENNDTKLRREAGIYDVSTTLGSGWTLSDKKKLTKLILTLSQNCKRQELKSKLSKLKREANQDTNEISSLEDQISKISSMSLKELALPIEVDYDWCYIANKLNLKHNPQEYKAIWKLFLHPSINKQAFSKKEHNTLLQLASKNNFQNWDSIAKQLNTNRSPYQCFVYFRTHVTNPSSPKKWTPQEEEYLKRIIEYYRLGNYIPWAKVVGCMENRTKIQVYNKYMRLLEERKGRFLPEEDAVILTFVDKHGPDFKRMKWYLPGRSIAQCRVRYQVLSTKRMSKVWTVEEDKKLLQLVANQEPPRNFFELARHFKNKERTHIRARYLTLEKWMKRNPNIDIKLVPRRPARQIKRGNKTDNLKKAILNLKKRMESELYTNKNKQLNKNSSEDKIDDAIIAVLVKEEIKREEKEKYKTFLDYKSGTEDKPMAVQNSGVNIKNLWQILIFLRAKLNKVRFAESDMGKKYSQLLQHDCSMPIFATKRSYSRKVSSNTVHNQKVPDIWGNNCLESPQHVLPPSYATIIACKTLMNYVSNTGENINMKQLIECLNQNVIFNNEMKKFATRFNSLFLWPMVLSNHMPPEIKPVPGTSCIQNPKRAFSPIEFQMKTCRSPIVQSSEEKVINESIDLKHDSNIEETTLTISFEHFNE
ncbi:unnamed protein product [Leptosia nina]|uniref:snRNA-activating protein complex subunit 4 n=1 Tax=Leptosia nina TaxID=320188 RepID=A0AAV1IY31_9NEOP